MRLGPEAGALSRGAASELAFAATCEAMGWATAWPTRHAVPYDLLVHLEGDWRTVQVKTARLLDGYLVADLRHGGGGRRGTYGPDAFDVLGVVYGRRVWAIPWGVVSESTTLTLASYAWFELGYA